MTEGSKHYIRCDRLFDDWQDDVLHGEPPRRFDIGDGLDHIRFGPGIGRACWAVRRAWVRRRLSMQCVVTAMAN